MKDLKIPIYSGFIIALFGSVLMLTLLGIGLLGPVAVQSEKEMIGGTILFLFIYLALLFGIYQVLMKKKKGNGNVLSFKDALWQGTVISFSTALMSVVFTYLFYEILGPNYVDSLLLEIREKMEINDIPIEKINEKILERTNYYRTSIQSLYSFSGNLITGLTFTLLLSFFLKSNQK